MRFKIDWSSLIVERRFTVFALFYFVFEGNFQVQGPGGGLYLEGRFNGGFFALRNWGAYIWRGLFTEFYGKFCNCVDLLCRLRACQGKTCGVRCTLRGRWQECLFPSFNLFPDFLQATLFSLSWFACRCLLVTCGTSRKFLYLLCFSIYCT